MDSTKMDKHDEYCWHCHKKETSLNCAHCLRSYHSECIPAKQVEVDENKWICLVCFKLKESEKQQSKESLKMLPKIVELMWVEKKVIILKDPLKNVQKNATARLNIINPIDLYDIKEKVNSYASCDALMNDINWMSHNISILESSGCVVSTACQTYAEALKELVEFIENEVEYMEKCPECYISWHLERNWFATVCNRPHCIVWAKVKGHSYWPGKAMSTNKDQVHVRFFGVHSYADVPSNKCYLYSDESPYQRSSAKHQRRNSTIERSAMRGPLSQAAMDETKLYLGNLKKKFGPFQLAQRNTPFVPTLLNHYIQKMMDGNYVMPTDDLEKSHDEGDQNAASADSLVNSTDSFQSSHSECSQTGNNCMVIDLSSDDEYEKNPITQGYSTEQQQTKRRMIDHGPTKQAAAVVQPNQFENTSKANGPRANLKRRQSCQLGDHINLGAVNRSNYHDGRTSADSLTDEFNVERSQKAYVEFMTDLKWLNAYSERAIVMFRGVGANHERVETKLKEKIRLLNESNAQQVNDLQAKIDKMQKTNDELQKEIDEIREEKDKEVKKAVEHIKKQEMEHSKLIEEDKKKAYCMACGTETDDVITCNRECAKRYWDQQNK